MSLAFEMRQRLTWSAPVLKWTIGPEQLLSDLDPEARARALSLLSRYDTSAWSRCCDRTDWRESLYALDLLDSWAPLIPEGRCLDVGAKNGCMLPGMATAVPRGWDAVEIDAHRRYITGATRRATGERMAKAFPGCRFLAGDIRDQTGPWALVTWFLPFLTPGPLAAWGLPERLLAPEALLRHVTERILPGGVLFVINQGEAEALLQEQLFRTICATPEALGLVRSSLSPFVKPRYAWRWRKPQD